MRRKPNKSGTVSVQVVEKRDGKYVVLQSFGASSTEDKILRLESKAQTWMDKRRGPQLPLWQERDEVVEDFVGGLSNGQLQVIGPELVYGTLYDHIGYDQLNNELFRHVVICRLFNPGSKLKTTDYLERYLHVKVSTDRIYRLELERRLKSANSEITLERAREITKTMYRLSFRLPDSRQERHVVLGMTEEQQSLVELAKM